MIFQFELLHSEFDRAVVWVYDQSDSWMIVTRFDASTTELFGRIEWNAPKETFKARILVYYRDGSDVQDVWTSGLTDSSRIFVRNVEGAQGTILHGLHADTEGRLHDPSRWMEEIDKEIADRRLSRMLFPGSHDSGSFSSKLTVAGIFAQTQSLEFGAQLANGVRAFDLRIGLTKKDPDFPDYFKSNTYYLHHGGFSASDMELDPQLEQLRRYAVEHPKEIILLLIHRSQNEWILPTEEFDDAARVACRDHIAEILVNDSADGGSLIFDYASHGKGRSCTDGDGKTVTFNRRIGTIKYRDVVAAGQNIIIIGDERNSGSETNNEIYWPLDTNSHGSWSYVKYVSDWGSLIGSRLLASEVVSADACDCPKFGPHCPVPGGPYVDDGVDRVGGSWFPGFRNTITQLLERRARSVAASDPESCPPFFSDEIAYELLDVGCGFSSLDIKGYSDLVNGYSNRWAAAWDTAEATRGALNLLFVDFVERHSIVPLLIQLNVRRARQETKIV